MRRLLIAPALALLLLAAASTASAAEPPDPCMLLTASDASAVLGSTPAKPRTKTVGAARSCTYAIKKKTMTVETTRVATQAAFDRSAKKGHGLAIPVEGVGADAWSVSEGTLLLIWKDGVQVSVAFAGVHPFVATQEGLAKAAAGRL